MPSKIHLICKDQAGLSCINPKAHIYRSEAWRLTPEEAAALPEGMVYFHQTKMKPSYFGGVIQSVEPIERPDEALTPGRQWYALTLKSTLQGRGLPWDKSGQSSDKTVSSGVIGLAEAP